jgi:uncharacterized protein YydD (DUF2326 family)
MFGLPIDPRTYAPTFRAAISYFIRPGRQAYVSPFETHRKQPEWSKQVLNAFLLRLDWQIASEWQALKDRRRVLADLKAASRTGAVEGLVGSIGELEAERVRLEVVLRRQREDLAQFRVHVQYAEIEREASAITERIHEAVNRNVVDTELLASYQSALQTEVAPGTERVASMYREAGVVLTVEAMRALEEVNEFHRQLVENRRQFLTAEVARISRDRAARLVTVRELTERRAELLTVLEEHGALDEYTALQQLVGETAARLHAVEQRIALLREIDEGESRLRIDEELLRQRAELALIEQSESREKAVRLFNEFTETMYGSPGNLVIEVGSAGYRFSVEIVRAGSGGVGHMQVFAYDLVLASMWAGEVPSPGLLIHDSIVFEGVDERQVASALVLARRLSEERQFQYICMLNSDQVPTGDLPSDLPLTSETAQLVLNDEPESDSLLGMRF